MTYITNATLEHEQAISPDAVMAVVDEFGIETPITEADILRTLKSMSEEKYATSHLTDMDVLMEHVYAARAVV